MCCEADEAYIDFGGVPIDRLTPKSAVGAELLGRTEVRRLSVRVRFPGQGNLNDFATDNSQDLRHVTPL